MPASSSTCKGREPQGAIEPSDLRALPRRAQGAVRGHRRRPGPAPGHAGVQARGNLPQGRNVAPDLIVHFGGLAWRSVGGVGYATIHVQENDTGPDDCNHAQYGASPGRARLPAGGEVKGAHLLDIAPTLLELGGYDVPAIHAGAVAGREHGSEPDADQVTRKMKRPPSTND